MFFEHVPGKANEVTDALSRRPDLVVVLAKKDELDGFCSVSGKLRRQPVQMQNGIKLLIT